MTATGFHCYKHIDLCYAWSVLCFADANMLYCAQDSAHVLDTISNMLTFIIIIANLFMLQNNDHQITIGKSLQ